MRWLLRRLAKLPFGPDTQRAIAETVADALIESRDTTQPMSRMAALARGFAAIARVISLACTSFIDGEHPMRFLGHDVRAAARRLWQSPVYLVFSIATLALAIGSTTAVYSVLDAALYRQQPIPHLSDVLNIYQSDLAAGASGPLITLSPHDFKDLSDSQTVFSDLAAWTRFSGIMVSRQASQQLLGEMVSGSYFRLLGVNAALGRSLQPADELPDARPVIVLSDGLWRRAFGADPAAVGQTLQLHGVSFEIVGVAPAWFHGTDMPNVSPTPAWIPMWSLPYARGQFFGSLRDQVDQRGWFLKGRLKPGVTLEAARAEVTAISQRIATADPRRRSQRDARVESGQPPTGWFVLPMAQLLMHESVHNVAGRFAALLMAAVLLVLLVGCSNLANLTLARSTRRRHEVAVRIALGASRMRIVREQLVESGIVAMIGWVAGLVVARGLMSLFGQRVDMHAALTVSLQLEPSLNVPVVLTSIGATALAVIAVGLGPAIRQSRHDVRGTIAAEGAVASRWRMRATLVTGQVAVSVMLLVLATLSLTEMHKTLQLDPGFDIDHLAVVQVDFTENRYDVSRVQDELAALQQAAGSVGGVASAAVVSSLPVDSGVRYSTAQVSRDNDTRSSVGQRMPPARWMAISGPALDTMGIKLLEGRTPDDRDGPGTQEVAVISQSLADEMFPQGHAVGQHLSVKRPTAAGEGTPTPFTVVGVAASTDTGIYGRGGGFAVYVSLAQHPELAVSLVARASSDPAILLTPLRQAMRRIDPQVAILTADTGGAIAGPSVMPLRVMGTIAGSLGMFALVLAVSGLYGVLSDLVSRRAREIGIRIALGAERRSILRMVLTDGLRPVCIGAVIGVGLAWYGTMLLPIPGGRVSLVQGTPLLFAIVPLAVSAVIACLLPARRASRVDPNVALRNL